MSRPFTNSAHSYQRRLADLGRIRTALGLELRGVPSSLVRLATTQADALLTSLACIVRSLEKAEELGAGESAPTRRLPRAPKGDEA